MGQGAEYFGGGASCEISFVGGGDAGRLQGARRDSASFGEVLHRHAGHRVHHSGRQAVDVAVPQRQAHGRCDGQNRHGHAARRADRRENRRAALRACQAGRVAAPRLRQDGDQARRGDRQGFARIAGRRDGAGGLLRRRCRKGVGQDGSKGGAGAYRDFARRFEGDARRCGYPHRTRRSLRAVWASAACRVPAS